ncbi:sensor histidine kinase [Mucilaginibacter sp. L196]|uniref:sensor histidine kinase n=1 Tax=Mucilaginibacter sp. L196 TaxID=1641870 RepID=UPI00131B079F|nr:sensor histidine kinase [Mucilaginibacter sp. L196]
MTKNVRLSDLKPHIIFWAIFITYEIVFIYCLVNRLSSLGDYVGSYFLNIGLFYFNAHFVFEWAINEKRRNYFLLILLIILEIIAYLIVKRGLYYIYDIFKIPISPPYTTIKAFFLQSVWRGVYFTLLSIGYWFALSTLKSRKKISDLENIQLRNELQNQVLEKSLLSAENAYLKSQINPHFLLNTLNFLYNSIAKFSEKTADSILLLSDIMRYALTSTDADGKVRLDQEIDNIESFLKLNQARFNQRLCIDYETDGDTYGLRIIPLVLITFVENVFKYADLLNSASPAKISIQIVGNTLIFSTYNLKRKSVQFDSHGIGIENVKSRLDNYYQYELIIDDNESDYKLMLKVNL